MEGFTDDSCLSIFGNVYETGAVVFPEGAHVLEIGCAEADWMTPMLAQRPDLHLTGIDWRPCDRPGTVVQGDVLTHDWPPNTFDAVVGISSIEHVGLGHYDADPLDADGDRHCLERVVRWLKPGGLFYADVPYGETYTVVGDSHRVYDDAALAARLVVPGLIETGRFYGQGTGWVSRDRPTDHAHMSYVALLARKANEEHGSAL